MTSGRDRRTTHIESVHETSFTAEQIAELMYEDILGLVLKEEKGHQAASALATYGTDHPSYTRLHHIDSAGVGYCTASVSKETRGASANSFLARRLALIRKVLMEQTARVNDLETELAERVVQIANLQVENQAARRDLEESRVHDSRLEANLAASEARLIELRSSTQRTEQLLRDSQLELRESNSRIETLNRENSEALAAKRESIDAFRSCQEREARLRTALDAEKRDAKEKFDAEKHDAKEKLDAEKRKAAAIRDAAENLLLTNNSCCSKYASGWIVTDILMTVVALVIIGYPLGHVMDAIVKGDQTPSTFTGVIVVYSRAFVGDARSGMSLWREWSSQDKMKDHVSFYRKKRLWVGNQMVVLFMLSVLGGFLVGYEHDFVVARWLILAILMLSVVFWCLELRVAHLVRARIDTFSGLSEHPEFPESADPVGRCT